MNHYEKQKNNNHIYSHMSINFYYLLIDMA